jgi:hypothetical protein
MIVTGHLHPLEIDMLCLSAITPDIQQDLMTDSSTYNS